jgi:tRNA (guanine26-N2/guanine27-N2)-dimethyltransferase
MTSEGFRPEYPTEIIVEGRANVLVPKLAAFVQKPSDYAPSKAPVFYNPVMEFNRDIAVLALQAYQKIVGRDIAICEPLAGCGVRSVRFAKELTGVKLIETGDINERAYRLTAHNVQINGVNEFVKVKKKEANMLLSTHSAPHKRFDVIDIDPFGSPVGHLDSAVRACRNDGLMALTATDMASLSGVHPKACVRKYGGKPLRTEYCHELAVRLLAGCLATVAVKHNVGIDLVFSHRGEHYVRVYARTTYGAKNADEAVKKIGFVLHCFKCFHRETVQGPYWIAQDRKCSECGSTMSLAGPLWIGKISDAEFCRMMEQEAETRRFRLGAQIRKTLSLIEKESDGPPTYFVIDSVCDALNLPVPRLKGVIESLNHVGFKASATHFHTRGVRVDAPASKFTRVVRELSTGKDE